jgi:hypothetical protein
VAFIIDAIVAPAGDCSMAMTRDCFEPASASLGICCDGFAAATFDAVVAGERFFADFDIEILHRFMAASAALPRPHLGARAGGAGSRERPRRPESRKYRSNQPRLPVLSRTGRESIERHLIAAAANIRDSFDTTACLVPGLSLPSPTTQSRDRGDFLNRRRMPATGGLPDMAKVSGSGRQSLSGDFAPLSLALKFAFPGDRRLELRRLGSRDPA